MNLQIDASTGPVARASAPSDRKMPITVPFWASEPNREARVVMQGTTMAVAETYQTAHNNKSHHAKVLTRYYS